MANAILTLEEFIGLSLGTWGNLDIARLNLMSARGLPGTENADIEAMLDRLDAMADRVRFEISRHLYRFDPHTSEPQSEFCYGNSLGRFCCWYMLQVLQEDCGVKYHPDRKFQPDFCEPQDLFIHGILDPNGKGGTCASMPVVYVAVARRLGFPVYLVETRGQLFFRWDDTKGTLLHWRNPDLKLWIPPDRFNVEGSGEGIGFFPDAHFMQWPTLWQQIDFDHGRYLRSMTTKEELAAFLIQRAECFYDLQNLEEALKAIYYARQLSPDDRRYEQLHARRTKEWNDKREMLAHIEEMEQDQRRRQKMLDQLSQRPNHGPSCQCWDCKQAKITAIGPLGVPGHPPRCLCPQCHHPNHVQSQPAATARPGQFPHQIPGANVPHQPNFGQPQHRGLPGH